MLKNICFDSLISWSLSVIIGVLFWTAIAPELVLSFFGIASIFGLTGICLNILFFALEIVSVLLLVLFIMYCRYRDKGQCDG